jgi:hypothetical protein
VWINKKLKNKLSHKFAFQQKALYHIASYFANKMAKILKYK